MTETGSHENRTEPADGQPSVTAHRCSTERTVFTERDNNDGWIATDLTVPLRR